MKLDRNINGNGRGKYALLKLRKVADFNTPGSPGYMHHASIKSAMDLLERHGILDWGTTRETEFFLIRLKDKYAGRSLRAYAVAAYTDDREYAEEISKLAARAGADHPLCKKPD
jgi:hypothetical protein